jgi:hypothetical protein
MRLGSRKDGMEIDDSNSQEITEKISIIPSNQSGVHSVHVYEVRPRKGRRGFDLISDVLPFGCLWYDRPNALSSAIGYAKHCSRSQTTVIRVYDAASNVIETHEQKGDFKEW